MVTSDPKDERPIDVLGSTETSADSVRLVPIGGAILRVGALGLNAWAVAVALPARIGGVYGTADLVLIALPLIALVLGLRAMARRDASALGLLAVAVPVLLVTAVAARADPALSDRYGTATTILAALSSLAYVIATADALGRPTALRATRESKLAVAARARPTSRGLRALVLGTTSTVALLLAIVLPALGTHASAAEAWGEAADEGRVLTAIVGAAIACIATGAIVGPSLRAARVGPTRPGQGALAVTLALVVAATGTIAWAILRSVGP
jgi:hypothetical protein